VDFVKKGQRAAGVLLSEMGCRELLSEEFSEALVAYVP
jgi:hypothetical protein